MNNRDISDVRAEDEVKEDNIETEKKMHGLWKRTFAVLLVAVFGSAALGFGLGIGIGIGGELTALRDYLAGKSDEASGEDPAVFTFGGNNGSASEQKPTSAETDGYAELVAAVEPAVVGITSTVETQMQGYFFYGPETYGSTGAGSGILFHETEDCCYIATNYHVVQDAVSVEVSVCGAAPVPAKKVGVDAGNDIAVISVSRDDLKEAGAESVTLARFGDSDAMRLGDFVLAIGNAFGEGNTVTNGMISAKDKEINVDGTTLTVFQTNAAINFGNSGGPLINLNGEVIGINTAKLSMNAEGMGYSIPSNAVKEIIEELMRQTPDDPKPMLGIYGRSITEEEAFHYNLPQAGAFVVEVIEGSAADLAELKRNDIITGFNGEPIFEYGHLADAVGRCGISDFAEVKFIRGGTEYMTVRVRLAERKDDRF